MGDDDMIGMIRRREQRGMEVLLRRYSPLMRYIIAPILPDSQDQEECLSESAMRAWEKIDLYDPQRGSWNSWLTSLTRNTALNRARRRPQAAEALEVAGQVPSPLPTPEESVLRRERREALARAIASLATGDRLLLYRKYYYMQPTAQIARELGMTERAVEGRLYRLKQKLRKRLGGEGHG